MKLGNLSVATLILSLASLGACSNIASKDTARANTDCHDTNGTAAGCDKGKAVTATGATPVTPH
jgi:hypothetical protein